MKSSSLFLAVCLLLFVGVSPMFAQWDRMSLPGGRGGSVYSLCVKDSFLFAGTDGGIYRSSDSGDHWTEVNPLLPPRYYSPQPLSLVVNGRYIIAAFVNGGVYMSSDNGEDWEQKIGGYPRSTPYELAASGDWIIAGYPASKPVVSVQSTDGGEVWASLPIGNVVSAAIQDSIALALTSSAIFRSTDHGATWTPVDSITYIPAAGSPIVFSGDHAYTSRSLSYYGTSRIISSSNRGLDWNDSSSLNCNSVNSIVASPSDGDYVFAATDSGVFRSSDNGTNWTPANNGLASPLVFSLVFKAEGTEGTPVLFAGTGNGVFRSSDYGETWVVAGSPSRWILASGDNELFAVSSNSSYYGLSKYIKHPENVFQTVVARSTDNGENWKEEFAGFVGDSACISSVCVRNDNSGGTVLFAGGYGKANKTTLRLGPGVVFTSTDYGASWTKSYTNSMSSGISALGTTSAGFLANVVSRTTGGGLYRTTDGGGTWTKVDSNLNVYQAICFDGQKIYAGGNDQITTYVSRVWQTRTINVIVNSTDNGESWTRVETPLDTGAVFYSQVDTISMMTSLCASGSHLFVGMQASYFKYDPYTTPVANGGGLYHLYFDGSRWNIADSSFMGRSVFGLTARGSIIFAGTDSGVFRTTDYGTTWGDVSSGMNRPNISYLIISGSYLFASTSNGIWKRPLTEITAVYRDSKNAGLPERYALYQNYPNPFNPTTTISYWLPRASRVSLKVYDVLGRKVVTLVNGKQGAGNHEVTFNAAGLSSGVYLYRFNAVDQSGMHFSSVRKLVVVK